MNMCPPPNYRYELDVITFAHKVQTNVQFLWLAGQRIATMLGLGPVYTMTLRLALRSNTNTVIA